MSAVCQQQAALAFAHAPAAAAAAGAPVAFGVNSARTNANAQAQAQALANAQLHAQALSQMPPELRKLADTLRSAVDKETLPPAETAELRRQWQEQWSRHVAQLLAKQQRGEAAAAACAAGVPAAAMAPPRDADGPVAARESVDACEGLMLLADAVSPGPGHPSPVAASVGAHYRP